MRARNRRVPATVDRVAGQARTARATRNRYLRGLARAIAAYEAEFGTISEAEMTAQQPTDRRTAIRIRWTRS
jgi:hypothetical protein